MWKWKLGENGSLMEVEDRWKWNTDGSGRPMEVEDRWKTDRCHIIIVA